MSSECIRFAHSICAFDSAAADPVTSTDLMLFPSIREKRAAAQVDEFVAAFTRAWGSRRR